MDYQEDFMDGLKPALGTVEQLAAEQQQVIAQQGRAYLDSLFGDSQTMPVRVRSIEVTNAERFRALFLESQLAPLLSPGAMTLADFLRRTDAAYSLLAKTGAMEAGHVAIGVAGWGGPAIPVSAVFALTPPKRFYAKTGTNVGNGEGDGYIQLQWKNVFGGGESVLLDAVSGTKTPASYVASLAMPLAANPNFWWDTLAYTHTRKWAQLHGSVETTGITSRVSTRFDGPINADVAVDSSWRRLSNHGLTALAVLAQLKDSFKTSVIASVRYDTRDSALLPTKGQYVRLAAEHGGGCTKVMAEAQAARQAGAHVFVATQRAGILARGGLLDRFFCGGPNDVRAFALHGLGPRVGNSAVGGDCYLSGGFSLVSRLPKVPKDSNFRLHSFFNYGKLVAGDWRQMCRAYSSSMGIGLLYNHPLARFELNFVLPLTACASDSTRKGLQYGVGVSFL